MSVKDTRNGMAAELDEIARLLALVVGRDRPLQDTIALLDGVGFGPSRIARLVGTTPGYVGVAITRTRKLRAVQRQRDKRRAK